MNTLYFLHDVLADRRLDINSLYDFFQTFIWSKSVTKMY